MQPLGSPSGEGSGGQVLCLREVTQEPPLQHLPAFEKTHSTMIAAIHARRVAWPAPYLDVRAGLLIPCVVTWDAETGEFPRAEGPRGFRTSEEAASFLRPATVTRDAWSLC